MTQFIRYPIVLEQRMVDDLRDKARARMAAMQSDDPVILLAIHICQTLLAQTIEASCQTDSSIMSADSRAFNDGRMSALYDFLAVFEGEFNAAHNPRPDS